MRRVAGSKEVEGSPGSRRVAGAIWSGYQCVYLQRRDEASPLSLIGDDWLSTELHRRRLSSTATAELNGDGGSSTATVVWVFLEWLFVFFFFFFLIEMALWLSESLGLEMFMGIEMWLLCL